MALIELLYNSISITTVLVVFIAFLLALRLFNFGNLPPGPRGWPIIGSLLHIGVEPHLTFEKWSKIYGDIFMVQLGWNNTLILNSIDVIKNALRDQGDKFTNRPSLPVVPVILTIPGSIAFDNGHTWSERRRWIFTVIRNFCTGRKDLGNRINLEEKVNLESGFLCQELDKQGKSFNPFHFINNAVSNIVCSVNFGDRFDYNDPKFKELIDGIGYLFKASNVNAPGNICPVLLHTPLYKRYRDITSSMKIFIENIIHQHQQTFDPSDIRDIIDAYLVESKKDGSDQTVFSVDLLWRSIFDLFNAGTDTTSATIMWTLLFLLNYPDVQKKVQKEVDDVLGQDRKPKWDDRHAMPFLQCLILEVQRLANVVPMTLRCTTDKVTIKGYSVPANTPVLVNMYSVHRNPDIWERPLSFEPERFLMEDMKTIKKQEALIPFGLGRRSCVGDLMTRMQLFLFLANLLQRFTFTVPEGKTIPSINECTPGLSRSTKPFEITVVKR